MSVRGRLYKNSLSQGSLVHQEQLVGWLLVRSWADACEQGRKERARAGGGPEKFSCGFPSRVSYNLGSRMIM